MRRAFFHVDEFREVGMEYLPYLACVCDPLVVWSPSSLLLKATQKAILEPRDLLSLVDGENAPVRVIGRAEWLLDEQFRNAHRWEYAPWVEEFDGVIKRFAIEDEKKPLISRRVIIAGREKGFVEADETLGSPIGERVARNLRLLFEKQLLPPGILEKARWAREERSSVPRAILRDMYNHRNAVVSADAQIAMTPSEHMAVLQRIVPNSALSGVTSLEPSGKGYASSADIREAVQVLRKVKAVRNMQELRYFLKSGLKADLHDLMYSRRSLPNLESHLIQKVNEATAIEPLFHRLFRPNDPIALTLTIGGFVLALAMYHFTGKPQWALVSVAVRAAQGPLRKYSLIPEAVRPGDKTRALFYLTFGTTRPRRRQVQELLSRL
jgi:hypothetical protein